MNINIGQLHSIRQKFTLLMIIIFLMLFGLPLEAGNLEIRDLKKFYQDNCVKCHGIDGSAVGEDGKKLKGEDFTNLKWREETKDEEMINTIMEGKFFGLAMPAFEDKITREDAQLIVTEIIRKAKKGKVISP